MLPYYIQTCVLKKVLNNNLKKQYFVLLYIHYYIHIDQIFLTSCYIHDQTIFVHIYPEKQSIISVNVFKDMRGMQLQILLEELCGSLFLVINTGSLGQTNVYWWRAYLPMCIQEGMTTTSRSVNCIGLVFNKIINNYILI